MEIDRTFNGAFFGSLIGVAAAIAATWAGFLNKDRELDIEMVRLSLSILAGENKDTSASGRRFALRALEKYSGIDIPPDDFELWVASGTLPSTTIAALRPNAFPSDPLIGTRIASQNGQTGIVVGQSPDGITILRQRQGGPPMLETIPWSEFTKPSTD